jgi:radical SAM protein with 4Fe4S-binding SPASM domain
VIRYTELKSAGRQDLRKAIPLAKPFTVLIEPTSLCNFRCAQCFQSLAGPTYFTRNRRHMPLDLFRRVLEQLVSWPGERHKVLKLSLYGEPLLSPDFSEMLRLAREADVAERMETTTNASLLTREMAEAMVASRLDYVRVSIYAADPERHRRITRSPLAPGVIHENLRVLQEVKREAGSMWPFVSCKMLDAYGDENEKFSKMYADVADEVYLDKPHAWIRVEGADFVEAHYGEDAPVARSDMAQHETGRVACPMAFTTVAVRSNGDVSPCCVDFIGGTNLGNAESDRIPELWVSDRWRDFQRMQLQGRKHENDSCARCDSSQSDHYTLDDIDGVPVEQLDGAS